MTRSIRLSNEVRLAGHARSTIRIVIIGWLVAGVMAGVAPATQYRDVSRVEVISSSDAPGGPAKG